MGLAFDIGQHFDVSMCIVGTVLEDGSVANIEVLHALSPVPLGALDGIACEFGLRAETNPGALCDWPALNVSAYVNAPGLASLVDGPGSANGGSDINACRRA